MGQGQTENLKEAVFGFISSRILRRLQDFRNYQYTLPVVKGLVVDMEVKKTTIKIPSNRYNEVGASKSSKGPKLHEILP